MTNKWTSIDVAAFEKAKASKKAAAQKNVTVSANALTKHALRILDLAGFHVWRQNNAAVFDPKRKVFRSNSATPGISDIIGFNRKTGQFIACEIKVGKDKLSTDQEMFLERINRCGGIGFVAHTIEDLEQFLKKVKAGS